MPFCTIIHTKAGLHGAPMSNCSILRTNRSLSHQIIAYLYLFYYGADTGEIDTFFQKA